MNFRGIRISLTVFVLSAVLMWVFSQYGFVFLKDSSLQASIAPDLETLFPTQEETVKIIQAEASTVPIKNPNIDEPVINAKAAYSVYIDNDNNQTDLFSKNKDIRLPLASLTKLMTATVSIENYDLSTEYEITEEAIKDTVSFSPEKLKTGEKFFVRDLVYALLIESSNEAGFSLANVYDYSWFMAMMNQKALGLKMTDTYFGNPAGLDFDAPERNNYSSASDLSKLAVSLLEKPFVWEILGQSERNLYTSNGFLHHLMKTTNEFIAKRPTGWKDKIIGGKTGWTLSANGCLLLVVRAPYDNGYIINIVLGADDRFSEMERMINWVYGAYEWSN